MVHIRVQRAVLDLVLILMEWFMQPNIRGSTPTSHPVSGQLQQMRDTCLVVHCGVKLDSITLHSKQSILACTKQFYLHYRTRFVFIARKLYHHVLQSPRRSIYEIAWLKLCTRNRRQTVCLATVNVRISAGCSLSKSVMNLIRDKKKSRADS